MLSQYADMIRQSVAADNPDDDDEDDDLHDDEATDLAYSIKDIAQLIGSPSDDSEEETEPAAAVHEARTEFYLQVLVQAGTGTGRYRYRQVPRYRYRYRYASITMAAPDVWLMLYH